MDKKSNRTDLLAAGREKLRQYRQKKDNKGKDGKSKDGKDNSRSTNKGDKSGKYDDKAAIPKMKAESSKLPEQEVESNSSVPDIVETVVDSSINSQKDLENCEGFGPVLVKASSNSELEYNIPNGQGEVDVDVHEGFVPSVSAGLEIVQGNLMTCTPDSIAGAAYGAEAVPEALHEAGILHEGNKVEAMQEADNVISNHYDQSVEVDFSGESMPSMSTCDGGSERAVTNNIPDNVINDHDRDHYSVNASFSVETIPVGVETVTRSQLHQQGGVMDDSSNEKTPHLQSMSNDSRCCENEGNAANLVREADQCCGEQSLFGGPGMISVESLIEKQNIYSVEEQYEHPGTQGNSNNLFMLAELLKRLPDGDFRYLITSREMVNHSTIVSNNEAGDLPQIFQEQLYIVNILKDFFALQLLEQHEQNTDLGHQHHRQLEQVPVLTSSLSDFDERNKSLAAELSQCRSELEVAMRERVELHNLYDIAKQDGLQNSAKADELHMKMEESVGLLSSVTGELVNCKVQFEVVQVENQKLLESLSSVTEQRNKFEEVMEQCIQESRRLSTDLADSGAYLAALQLEISNLKMSLASANDERKKLEEEKESLVQEKEMLLGELADCKSIMAALQQENADLNVNLVMVTKELNKLKEHEECLSQEVERLSGELVVSKDNMLIHQGKVQLEADLKETMSRVEQLAEENVILQSSLEIHKAKLAKADSRHQLPSQIVSVGAGSNYPDSTSDHGSLKTSDKDEDESVVSAVGPAPDEQRLGLQNDVSGVVAVKGYLEEVEKMIQKLENAINGLHSQSTTHGLSANRGSTPGVSKLIQAFESNPITNGCDPEGTENTVASDLYSSAKGNLSHLRTVLSSVAQNVKHTNALIIEEKDGHRAANVAHGELEVEIEDLKGINCNLEMRNIELEVLCGAMTQHAHDIEAKKNQLESLCEDLKQQGAGLQSQNIELVKKLADCQSRIDGLQFQLTEIQRSSDEVTSAIYDGFKSLQGEMRDDIYAVDRQWKSFIGELVPMVEKLNITVGSAVSFPHDSESGDIFGHFAFSLSSACEVIEQLKMKLEAADKDYETLSSSYEKANKELLGLNEEHNSAIAVLQKVSGGLVNLLNVFGEQIEVEEKEYNRHDALYCEALLAKFASLLADRMKLEESHSKLHSDLLSRARDIEELQKRVLDEDALLKLVLDVKEVLQLQDTEIELNEAPISVLHSSVLLLIQKYKQAEAQVNLLTNDMNSRMIEIGELHGHVELLDSFNFQQQNEILVLKESLMHAKDVLDDMLAELLSKVRELEQSEQRVASVREKLSIAVAKGKGLVAQRDSLKQSLAEMSGELEKYSQELQLKDSRIHEVEEKLKAYSEAGERMEALESELSYIRNSATALRESFVLKDSALQRIEEILEDLELPDHFHSKDIIEKVDWLAKSVTCNSLLPANLEQRGSVELVSSSDGCKEDVYPTSNPIDDLRRKYDELQTKFYELAEQNDMLEQSLMERNILVQRWEEILDRINTPPQIRSMEPEERIHWLGTALSEADSHMRSLQQKVGNLENYCGSLSVDLEESQRKTSECAASLQAVLHEKEKALSEANDDLKSLERKIDSLESYCGSLSADLEESQRRICELESSLQDALHVKEILSCNIVTLMSDHEIALISTAQYEHEVNKLGKEISMLQGKLAEDLGKENHIRWIESEEMFALRRELAEAVDEVTQLREERDAYVQKNQSLASEFEVLQRKTKEFQDLLNQEEQKSASLREKLNLAVRKGKSVVQQRDSLKQNNEEMALEIEQLKSKINNQEHFLLECRQKISDLSLQIERYKAFESENLSLKDQLMETEERLQRNGHTLHLILRKLGEIDADGEIDAPDPVQKLEGIAKLCCDLRATAASFEQEAKRSRKASELLLAELNEVQERNDDLQEELSRTHDEISSLSRERDLADSAKVEALSHLAKLSEERRDQLAELKKLNSSVHEVKKGFFEICTLANDVFGKDIDLLNMVRTRMKSCLDGIETGPVGTEDLVCLVSANSGFKGLWSTNLSWDKTMPDQLDENLGFDVIGVMREHLQQLTEEISSLKDRIYGHSMSLSSESEQWGTVISNVLREKASQTNSLQSIKDECLRLESTVKERDMEAVVMHRSISLLYEGCASSILEIENTRAGLVGETLAAGDVRVNLPALPSPDGGNSSGFVLSSYETCVKTLVDRLLLAVKDITEITSENVEGRTKDMRSTILNLQKELQEKDIQREQVCTELVSQIKEAESTAANYSRDLQSMKNYAQDLESKLEATGKERSLLEQKIVEFQQGHLSSIELGEKVKSLTDLVAAKEQEIEALMQALDEEENQMEVLRSKIDDLEKVVEQKSIDLEHVEASRAKALKKLSVTMSKFDELHHMSEGLLSEIENLQSQLQDQDAEISFLRQEVTRCTNDALEATKMVKDTTSREFNDLLAWLDAILSSVLTNESRGSDGTENDDDKRKEHLQKDIMSIISELQELRVATQRKDVLLQMERNRVEELSCRKEALEVSLQQKEHHLSSLQTEDSGLGTSEIVEVEPVLNKWTTPVTSTTSQVRSLRKVNNDQVSIAIDTDAGSSGRFEDEDDDKVHGFKSLTTSRFVPKFTRPVSDMIDGLWVSCDRTLMRQPAFRLGIMIYWAVLHALLASFIV